MPDFFDFADDLGPVKVIYVHETSIGLDGILIVDNVAVGPSIGGLRMAPDVTVEECFRLARAMTLKNAAAGLRHGGGKSVLRGDPAMPRADKEKLIRGFAAALAHEDMYIFGPDMGTNEECMAWVHDEIGRSVGLPKAMGGIPLDELGATGFGCAHAAKVASEYCDLKLEGARVAVQGFGSVGIHAARFLAEQGSILIAAADSHGTIHDQSGLDIQALSVLKRDGKAVTDHTIGEKLGREDIVGVDCDIWIPAARPDVINETNVDQVKSRLIIQGANIPITKAAEQILHDRGVLIIPDFIANAGGVICAAMEYAGSSQTAAFLTIKEKIRNNTREILETMRSQNILPREAAMKMAEVRVRKAMDGRRWTTF